jgi:hypothetical protein
MPILLEPVKQIESIEIQPSITKIENSQVNGLEVVFILFVILFLYLIRGPLLAFAVFLFKLGVVSILGYCSYILFIQ